MGYCFGVQIEEKGEAQQIQGLAVIHIQESENYGEQGDGRNEGYFSFQRAYLLIGQAFMDEPVTLRGVRPLLIERQAEDPSLSSDGMNDVRFPINYYFRSPLISYIFSSIHH